MLHPRVGSTAIAPYIRILNHNDVLQGRGAGADRYEGNIRFRALVRERQSEYRQASHKEEKDRIAVEILLAVQTAGGRFVRKVDSISEAESLGIPPGQQGWLPIDQAAALEKVKQALRDKRYEVLPSNSGPLPVAGSLPATMASTSTSTGMPQVASTASRRVSQSTANEGPFERQPSSGCCIPTLQSTTCQPENDSRWNRSGELTSVFSRFGASTDGDRMSSPTRQQTTFPPSLLDGPRNVNAGHFGSALLTDQSTSVTLGSHVRPPFSSPPTTSSRHPDIEQTQRGQDLQQQLAAALVGDHAPSSTASDMAAACRIAASWRDIPETYQTFFPVVPQQPLGPNFTSKDLRVLLLTRALAESTPDVDCLAAARGSMSLGRPTSGTNTARAGGTAKFGLCCECAPNTLVW
jgi:hypothetical protein